MHENDIEERIGRYRKASEDLATAFIDSVARDLAKAVYEAAPLADSVNLMHGFDGDENDAVIEAVERKVSAFVTHHPELVEVMRGRPEWLATARDHDEDNAAYAAVSAAMSSAEGYWSEMAFTAAEIERRAVADYTTLAGQVVLARVVDFVAEDGGSECAECDPPALVRIAPYSAEKESRDCAVRWMDDLNIDPIYDVEILEPHPALPGISMGWVYGQTWTVGKGATEPPRFDAAPDYLQAQYRETAEPAFEDVPEDMAFRP